MQITVRAPGRLAWNGYDIRCALGPAGIRHDKREGDGATPAGRFVLRCVLYRADRLERPRTGLPCRTIEPADGWCDDPADPLYNRPVQLPYPASAERLWRDDEVYDLIVVLGHNDDPVVPGLGSAVFLHIAKSDYGPTAGCVAVARDDLLALLADADETAVLIIAD